MAKTVVVHIHPTADAGFDESKVKRDEGGKFSHSAAAAEHTKQAKHHHEQAIKSPPLSPAESAHEDAMMAHTKAARLHTRAHEDPVHASRAHASSKEAHAASGSIGGKKEAHPDDELASMRMQGTGKETLHTVPKPPAGVPGGPRPGRGPVDLGTQSSGSAPAKQTPEAIASQQKINRMKEGLKKMKGLRVPYTAQPEHLREIRNMEERLERAQDDHDAKHGKKPTAAPATAQARPSQNAPAGFKINGEGHFEASAEGDRQHAADLKTAAVHLEASGFRPDPANSKSKTIGTGTNAVRSEHTAYQHPDGRQASIVRTTTKWGGTTKIKHGTKPAAAPAPAHKEHGSDLNHDQWQKKVEDMHGPVDMKKNAKDGKVHAYKKGTPDHVGTYTFEAGLKPASHYIREMTKQQ